MIWKNGRRDQGDDGSGEKFVPRRIDHFEWGEPVYADEMEEEPISPEIERMEEHLRAIARSDVSIKKGAKP